RMVLIGQRMRQLMRQREQLFIVSLGGVQHEQALLFVIVESGRLFSQQVPGFPGKIEILRNQSEHFERNFGGARFLAGFGVLDALFHHSAKVVLGQILSGNASLNAPPCDFRERQEDLVDLGKERPARRRRLLRRRGSGQQRNEHQRTRDHGTRSGTMVTPWQTTSSIRPNISAAEPSRSASPNAKPISAGSPS